MPPEDIPSPLKLAGVTYLRYVLTALLAALEQRHLIDHGTVSAILDPVSLTYLAGLLVVASFGAYARLKSRFKTNTALTLPPDSTHTDLQNKVDQASVAQIVSTKPVS